MSKGVPERITADWLREQGACPVSVVSVRRSFPHGIRPTERHAARAARLKLSPMWLARRLLSQQAMEREFLDAYEAEWGSALCPDVEWVQYQQCLVLARIWARLLREQQENDTDATP